LDLIFSFWRKVSFTSKGKSDASYVCANGQSFQGQDGSSQPSSSNRHSPFYLQPDHQLLQAHGRCSLPERQARTQPAL